MRRNDFFKYLLLGGGGSASRSELESETLPYTFNSNSYKLRNYRIYGNTVNGESVGDLVTEGEHSGEYLVPVTVEWKNLYSGTSETIPISPGTQFINYTFEVGTTYTISFDVSNYESSSVKYIKALNNENSSSIPLQNGRMVVVSTPINSNYPNKMIYITSALENPLVITNIQIEKGSTATPYEPYHAPVTTNLYLPEQIKMVGDDAEYVDYKEQKQYFADGTSTDVTLPALPTLSGTNTLSVGTTVQPSKVYLQGKISEAEIVSAEPVQTNVQSLQPLSLDDDDLQLDVMPSDDLQLDVMPSNDLQLDVIIPTANLNRIEDDEDAE